MFHILADAAQATSASPYQIRMPAWLVTTGVGAVLPLVVALLTKVHAHAVVKGIVLAAVAAATGLIVQGTIDDGTAVLSSQGIALACVAFASGVISHFGLLDKSGVEEALAPSVGIGPPAPRRRVDQAPVA